MSTRYTVRPGDSLSSIASRNGLSSWRDIYDHPDNATFRTRRPNPNLVARVMSSSFPDGPKSAMDPGSKTPADPQQAKIVELRFGGLNIEDTRLV